MEIMNILIRLKQARQTANVTLLYVAKSLGYKNDSMIELIEEGHRPLKLSEFLHMCELYNVSPIWVLGFSDCQKSLTNGNESE